MKQKYLALLIVFIVSLFFYPLFFQGKLPVPADTIVGLYHPFRDLYSGEYPNGIPFKNFLITDPVRQQIPWRFISLEIIKEKELPLWNPYAFSGYPLLGNFQSAVFNPLNIFILLLPFWLGWTIIVLLQPILAALFMFYYLAYLRLTKIASFLGGVTFAFSGFMIAWLEWGTLGYVIAFVPLILLSLEQLIRQWTRRWAVVFTLSAMIQLFSGHLQVWFYTFILINLYLLFRLYFSLKEQREKITFLSFLNAYKSFLLLIIFVLAATSIQWIPSLILILQSGRDADQVFWQNQGWFIPWQHLIQFVVPDFFGNPTTLNYWGVWNYAEFVGYIGLAQLIFATTAIINLIRKNYYVSFFAGVVIFSLIFSLPTPLAVIPFTLDIPLLSTSQPTRLLSLIDLSLAILSAFGFNLLIEKKQKKIITSFILTGLILAFLWLFVNQLIFKLINIDKVNLLVAKRNLIFPTVIFLSVSFAFVLLNSVKRSLIRNIVILGIIIISLFDLFRFFHKFTSFSPKNYLFPTTKTISFLQNNLQYQRFMTVDDRILPPNFSIFYKLESVNGYDPLYLRRYAEYIAASERAKPDISPPWGFNRIITPKRFDSRLIDMLGTKYILSLVDLNSPKIKKIFTEGETRVYENKAALPRVILVNDLFIVPTKQKAIEKLFEPSFNPQTQAVGEFPSEKQSLKKQYASGSATILYYSPTKIIIKTVLRDEGFLVLFDPYYPTWRVFICSSSCTQTEMIRTNFLFRGVVVPGGEHTIEFRNNIF
ncbi:MAG: hypothetical protein KatS3mg089_0387 [Patescibacteria group bacterium]|nr:MAG: hypothetical protein KatS3mg089_0387 [Patescibacteria group bacterium]